MNPSAHPTPRIIPAIVRQHLNDAESLYETRSALVSGRPVRLRQLGGFDERLTAHLEGLQVAGAAARSLYDEALEVSRAGAVFVAAIRALELRDLHWLERLLALCEWVPECRAGLVGAFAWTERGQLQGVVSRLLKSDSAFARLIGVTACGVHRVDPGLVAARMLDDPDPALRARAYRTAGELGKREFVSRLGAGDRDDAACEFWAAWAAVLLGDRHDALERLIELAGRPGPYRLRALQLAYQALNTADARPLVQAMAQDRAQSRLLIRAVGLIGDPAYVSWLIGLMTQDAVARAAGEAFSLICGIDAQWLDLERPRPENFESGPNDDPQDAHVDMDEDDGLPWPDGIKVQAWWHSHSERFSPGARYFMGLALDREPCRQVLKTGFQRQRIAAAVHLSLLDPGTPLFEWRAPALRQQQRLAQIP